LAQHPADAAKMAVIGPAGWLASLEYCGGKNRGRP
jgi:hypothetical protein